VLRLGDELRGPRKGKDMIRFRREFLKTAAVTATFASLPAQAAGAATQFGAIRRGGIATLFDDLPGDLGFKIHAP